MSRPTVPGLGGHSSSGTAYVVVDDPDCGIEVLLPLDRDFFRRLPKAPAGTIALVDVIDAARGVRDMRLAASLAAAVDGPMLVQPGRVRGRSTLSSGRYGWRRRGPCRCRPSGTG
jgi:hypothetical protein